jgi:hypothetical protein
VYIYVYLHQNHNGRFTEFFDHFYQCTDKSPDISIIELLTLSITVYYTAIIPAALQETARDAEIESRPV